MDRHPLTGREVHLVRYPRGEVRESDFRVVDVDIADPGPGQVLVRNTWTSVDAAHRLRLREKAPPGYFAAFPLGRAMDGIATVGEVVASRADGFEAGDTVRHAAGWRDYALIEAGRPELGGIGTLMRVDTDAAAPEAYLGALGGSGLTAYVGLFDVAGLREGDVVWVSAAAGSVGSLVAQMAKIRGHRVIGSAGSDDKVSYLLDELGLDAAFNYKAGPVAELLRAAAPDGIDVYFDNVGGDHLEAAIGALRRGGRVALCGAISEYDASRPAPGPEQPLPRRRERPHPARLPWQQPRRPDGRDDARDRQPGCARDASAAGRPSSTGSSTPRRPSPVSCAAIRPARRWCGSRPPRRARSEHQDRLDRRAARRVGDRGVDVVEVIGADQLLQRQPPLGVQVEQPREELLRAPRRLR